MPIEIKITDIENLDTKQITALYNYLMFCSGNEKDDTETEPEEINENTEIEIVARPIKKRKKREVKQDTETVFIADKDLNAIEIPAGEPGQIYNNRTGRWEDEVPQPPLTTQTTVELTYEEVVSFVLENVREKKITFDQMSEVLNSFNVVNLNSLSGHPELVEPVYLAIKELISR